MSSTISTTAAAPAAAAAAAEYFRLVNFRNWTAATAFYHARADPDSDFAQVAEGLFVEVFYLRSRHAAAVEYIDGVLAARERASANADPDADPDEPWDVDFYAVRLAVAKMHLAGTMSLETARDLINRVEDFVGRPERLTIVDIGTLVAYLRILQTGRFESVVMQLPEWYWLRFRNSVVAMTRDLSRWFAVFDSTFPQYFGDFVAYVAVTERCGKRALAQAVAAFVSRVHPDGEDGMARDTFVQVQMLAGCRFFENLLRSNGGEREEEERLCAVIRGQMDSLHEYLGARHADYRGSGLEARYRAAVGKE